MAGDDVQLEIVSKDEVLAGGPCTVPDEVVLPITAPQLRLLLDGTAPRRSTREVSSAAVELTAVAWSRA